MRFPKITSLYGRIFAIFWFTMLMVLVAVLYLSHLDPRKQRDIPPSQMIKYERIRDYIESKYQQEPDLQKIIRDFNRQARPQKSNRPSLFLADLSGNILTGKARKANHFRELRNFVTGYSGTTPKQRLYGHYLIAGHSR